MGVQIFAKSIRKWKSKKEYPAKTFSDGSAGGIEEDTITFPLCRFLIPSNTSPKKI